MPYSRYVDYPDAVMAIQRGCQQGGIRVRRTGVGHECPTYASGLDNSTSSGETDRTYSGVLARSSGVNSRFSRRSISPE